MKQKVIISSLFLVKVSFMIFCETYLLLRKTIYLVATGIGIEIIADDADIESLLDQNKVEKLSLDHLMKYQDKIKLQV